MPFRGPDMAMSTRAPGPRFSSGSDESELARPLQALLAPAAADGQTTAADGGRWALIPNGEGLERSFKFKTFAKTWVSRLFGRRFSSVSSCSDHLSICPSPSPTPSYLPRVYFYAAELFHGTTGAQFLPRLPLTGVRTGIIMIINRSRTPNLMWLLQKSKHHSWGEGETALELR